MGLGPNLSLPALLPSQILRGGRSIPTLVHVPGVLEILEGLIHVVGNEGGVRDGRGPGTQIG